MSVGDIPARVRALVAERSQGRCEICREPATEMHHRDPRGMGGTSDQTIHRVSNLLHLCRSCHSWCESRRTHAEYAGWLIRSGVGTDPATMRVWLSGVLYGAGWWLLDDEGILKRLYAPAYELPERPVFMPPLPARPTREGMPPRG